MAMSVRVGKRLAIELNSVVEAGVELDVVVVDLNVGAGSQEDGRRKAVGDLAAHAGQAIAQEAIGGQTRAIEPGGHGKPHVAVFGEAMIVAKIDAVKLRAEERHRLIGGELAEVVVRSEREDTDAIIGCQIIGGARLVIPVVELNAGCEKR